MRCKKANIKDAKVISKIVCDTIRNVNYKDYTEAQINAWINNNSFELIKERLKKGRLFFVILNNKIVVGVSSLNLEKQEIGALYIQDDLIDKGFGSALLVYVEKYAKRHKLKYIKLFSSTTASSFYSKKGYIKIRKISQKINGVNILCVLMKKNI